MMTDRAWTEAFLESQRQIKDPVADDVIKEFFETPDDGSGNNPGTTPPQFLNDLMNYRIARRDLKVIGGDTEIPVPRQLINKVIEKDPFPIVDQARLKGAQRLFRDYGPEILTMYGYYSLPTAYGAANGANVLDATKYLEKRAMRRVIETTQLVIDVLSEDGFKTSEGNAFMSATEVRLMHAAIRHLIKSSNYPWKAEWGEPINQEDLAGTLMTFSTLVLDGFDALNVRLTKDAEDSFMYAWAVTGRLLGIKPEMIPNNYAEAQQLWSLIRKRQFKGSEVGRKLTRSLLDAYAGQLKFPFSRTYNSMMMRFYMDPQLADDLGVPRNAVADNVGKLIGRAYGVLDNFVHTFPATREGYRLFSRYYIMALTMAGRGHEETASFDLPLELSDFWDVPATSHRPGTAYRTPPPSQRAPNRDPQPRKRSWFEH